MLLWIVILRIDVINIVIGMSNSINSGFIETKFRVVINNDIEWPIVKAVIKIKILRHSFKYKGAINANKKIMWS